MAIVGRVETLDIPHELGQTMQFRRLTGFEMDQAEERTTQSAMKVIAGIDPAVMAAWAGQGRTEGRQRQSRFDKETLVQFGVIGWSYAEPCTDENKAKLDAWTRDWAAAVIEEMNVRSEGEGEGSGGNSSRGDSPLSLLRPTTSGKRK